ncbi:MAG: response regulator [Burkholderiaceae bacterium]|nr:response regulator [Burkholderiaceae bacterium]
MRILYVDDNAADAQQVLAALHAADAAHVIEGVASLAAARAALAHAERYDLLLTDLHLPDGHGLDLVLEVRERALPLAVVALTRQGDESVAIAALRAGADDYLAKRDDLADHLVPTLQAACQRASADRQRRAQVLRVLYVERQTLDIDLTRRHLERHAPHLRLAVARDAAEALARLPRHGGERGDIDLVLCDYRLVGDSGLDLLKELREMRGLDLPVVIVTGQGSEDVAAEALRLGATDYLVKHAHWLQALPLALENAWHRVQAAREHEALRRLNAELEARVARRTKALEAANRELEAFSYSVSHDLRAPLRAIDGLSAMLLRDHLAALDDDGQRLLNMLRDSARRMDRLIIDLLGFARTAREPLQRAPVRPAPLVRNCLDELRDEIERRGIAIAVGELPPCEADANLLRQVFANLLSNAVKYTRRQSAARIEIGATQLDGAPAYFVRDNGAGFDMRHAGKLFGVFQRLHRADEFEGTGVGLAIVARIVDRHGGRIVAEAAPGRGACFTFRLTG